MLLHEDNDVFTLQLGPAKKSRLEKKLWTFWKALNFYGGFIEAKSNFRGLFWTFSPKYAWKYFSCINPSSKTLCMKTLACVSRRSGMRKPRCRARRTESRPKIYALHCTVKHEGQTAENARVRTTSVSPMHAGNLVLKQGKNKFFGKWQWLGQRHMDRPRVIMWVMPFTGFSTNSTLTLWILCEHSKPQPTWCTLQLPLLLYSTQHLHRFTGRNSCGHSPFLYEDGASSWMACARSYQPTLLVQKVFHSKLTTWPRKSSQVTVETEWGICHIGQVQWRLFFSSSLRLRLLSEFSPYSEPPFQVSRRLHSFMWKSAWWCTTIIAETIKCWCVRVNCI